ncbi:unnamed protein product [Parascedosporium putredinis]|uniref:Uncharacterized protein n=1 Tax=Parascedosporium putredinis TaxID=1442378 RepID=A0A9P1HAJ1_9PEZI|nr:unnamed protein product [Parascedosporium putredinis]CAI8001884.1 unnamed protein product [Parascedosporium putredinis]
MLASSPSSSRASARRRHHQAGSNDPQIQARDRGDGRAAGAAAVPVPDDAPCYGPRPKDRQSSHWGLESVGAWSGNHPSAPAVPEIDELDWDEDAVEGWRAGSCVPAPTPLSSAGEGQPTPDHASPMPYTTEFHLFPDDRGIHGERINENWVMTSWSKTERQLSEAKEYIAKVKAAGHRRPVPE